MLDKKKDGWHWFTVGGIILAAVVVATLIMDLVIATTAIMILQSRLG